MSRAECSRNFFSSGPIGLVRLFPLHSAFHSAYFPSSTSAVFMLTDRSAMHSMTTQLPVVLDPKDAGAKRCLCHPVYLQAMIGPVGRTSYVKAIFIRSLTRSRAISLRRAAEGGPQTQDASSNRSNGVEELFSRIGGHMLEFSTTTRRRLLSSGNFAQSIEHFFARTACGCVYFENFTARPIKARVS